MLYIKSPYESLFTGIFNISPNINLLILQKNKLTAPNQTFTQLDFCFVTVL